MQLKAQLRIYFRGSLCTSSVYEQTTSTAFPVPMEYTHHLNARRLSPQAESDAAVCMKNLAHWDSALNEICTWPEYNPQPLRNLLGLANTLGVNQMLFKDESRRFGAGMGSFKALGARYAVYKILSDEVYAKIGIRPSSAELRTTKYRNITQQVTVCVATDGNQGRGLAYGAKCSVAAASTTFIPMLAKDERR